MVGDGRAGRGQSSPPSVRGAFLITVDTEGDNLWSRPRDITVRNAEVLPRFQELCERHGLRPTYLTEEGRRRDRHASPRLELASPHTPH
jgi:hypothetical protein